MQQGGPEQVLYSTGDLREINAARMPGPGVLCLTQHCDVKRNSQKELVTDTPGSARLVLVEGVLNLNDELAVFEAILTGWSRQQSRMLAEHTIAGWERLVHGANTPPLDATTASKTPNKARHQ
jgi:hypothetical protein